MFKILVCGGRDFEDGFYINLVLDKLTNGKNLDDILLIQGDARGADICAREWARMNQVTYVGAPAPWNRWKVDHPTKWKTAGFFRNKKMLEWFTPDLVVAFPGGNGTADMIKQSHKSGVKVEEIPYDKEEKKL